MTRWSVAALSAVAIAAGVCGVVVSTTGQSGRGEAADARPAPGALVAGRVDRERGRAVPDSVRVEHALIRVHAVRSLAPSMRAARPRAVVPALRTGREPFVQRAGRVLLGDGRYRPQPFPRPAAH